MPSLSYSRRHRMIFTVIISIFRYAVAAVLSTVAFYVTTRRPRALEAVFFRPHISHHIAHNALRGVTYDDITVRSIEFRTVRPGGQKQTTSSLSNILSLLMESRFLFHNVVRYRYICPSPPSRSVCPSDNHVL